MITYWFQTMKSFVFIVLNKIKFLAQLYAAPEYQLINYPDGYTNS